MTPLGEKLTAQIRESGPMTVADFMAACLADPEHGYYMRAEPFGGVGDFITAPEISQMFGELVGLWAVAAWELMGEPETFELVELGPGRGTLMSDLIRAALVKPTFLKAARLRMVEMSPRLREVQKKALEPTGLACTWHLRLRDIPAGPAIFIANEFFDAMPVRQFQMQDGSWSERVIGLNADGELAFDLAPITRQPAPTDLPEETIVEAAPLGQAVMTSIGERLAESGGAALVIDYGSPTPGTGSTLQAVRNHAYQDPLEAPGEADLTAHVDFSALARAAESAGARPRTVIPQGEFLVRLGLVERANVLGRDKEEEVRDGIATALQRLAGPKGMGELFKVLAISAPNQRLPIFDADAAVAEEALAADPAPKAKKKRAPATRAPRKRATKATKTKASKSATSKRPAAKSKTGKPHPSPGHEKEGKTRH